MKTVKMDRQCRRPGNKSGSGQPGSHQDTQTDSLNNHNNCLLSQVDSSRDSLGTYVDSLSARKTIQIATQKIRVFRHLAGS